MNALEKYFDRIVVIHLLRRADRWARVEEQFKKFGITRYDVFEAHDRPLDHTGKPNGNSGCTASHRGVFELICHHKWKRCLIFEDDVEFLFEEWPEMFEAIVPEIPDDYAMFYLGGHFGEPPIARVSDAMIRIGRMLTTSSYSVSYEFARKVAPQIQGVGPIDSLLSGYHRDNPCYIMDPRICAQFESFSDLTDRPSENKTCMTDRSHIEMV